MKTAACDDERISAKSIASMLGSWVKSQFFLGKLKSKATAAEATNTIPVKGSSTVHYLSTSSIEHLKARVFHASLKLSNGETVDSIQPLCALESKLDIADGFYKCHHRYIVNINQVSTYTSDEVIMRSGCRIPISRKCKADFKDAYFSTIFGEGPLNQQPT